MTLSAEAQHVIDSLEAHLGAVKAAVSNAEAPGESVLQHLESFASGVLAAIEAFGAKLRGASSAGPTTNTSTEANTLGNPNDSGEGAAAATGSSAGATAGAAAEAAADSGADAGGGALAGDAQTPDPNAV
jgi:hypothetical protein